MSNECPLTLRQANQARADFYAIAGARFHKGPTRAHPDAEGSGAPRIARDLDHRGARPMRDRGAIPATGLAPDEGAMMALPLSPAYRFASHQRGFLCSADLDRVAGDLLLKLLPKAYFDLAPGR